jgi:hypothetical protein
MMKKESELSDPLSRRSLLGRAVGAAGIMAALGSTGQADAQMQPADDSGGVRVRDSFDFGWKFFKGNAQGAQQPTFADASVNQRYSYNASRFRMCNQAATLVGVAGSSIAPTRQQGAL